MVKHILLPFLPVPAFFLCDSPLSHRLHNLKRLLRIQSHTYQIRHNVIARADCRGNCRLSLLNQRLCIAEPNICSVRQSGDSDKVGKIFRLRINDHLHRKIRAKFWNAKAAQLTASDVLRRDAER